MVRALFRLLYEERRDALMDALRREMGDILDVAVPEAGLHLIAWLPSGMSAQIVAHRAAAKGLRISLVSHFGLRPLPREGLVFGFASASPDALRAGVHTLALALRV